MDLLAISVETDVYIIAVTRPPGARASMGPSVPFRACASDRRSGRPFLKGGRVGTFDSIDCFESQNYPELVKWNRRLVPYVLVGVLTLGAGLAIGLSLSEGPLTVNDAGLTVSQSIRCTASVTNHETTVSCTSHPNVVSANGHFGGTSVTLWFPRGARVPKGFTSCMQATLQPSDLTRVPDGGASSVFKNLKPGTLPSMSAFKKSTRSGLAAALKYERSSQGKSQQKAFDSAVATCGVTKGNH
jgi:hypothetical protein